MLDHTDDHLIRKAFMIAAKDERYGPAHVVINGEELAPYDDYDGTILVMLTHSQVREKLEELRDYLDEVLGEPEQTVRPNTPDEELCEAEAILRKHIESGYIEGYDCDAGGHLVWHPTFQEDDDA